MNCQTKKDALYFIRFGKMCCLYAAMSCVTLSIYSQELSSKKEPPVNISALQRDTAIVCKEEALRMAIKNKDWSLAAKADLDLGSLNYEKFRYDLAIDYHLQGIEFAKKAGDLSAEVDNLYYLGVSYSSTVNYPAAMEYLLQALKLSPKINNLELDMRINNRIGMIYKYVEDYEHAKSYFITAYNEYQQIKKGPIYDFLMNLGNVEQSLGNYTESLAYYQKFLSLNPKNPFTRVLADNNMGSVYLKLDEPDKALAYFDDAYNVEDTVKNPRGRAYSFYNFATVAQVKGDYLQAINYAIKSMNAAEYYKVRRLEFLNYDVLADCYQKTGNHQLGNEYLRKSIALKDSVFRRKGIDKMKVAEAALRVEMETEKKQQQIISLQKDNALKELQVSNLVNVNRISYLQLANLNKERSLAQLQMHNMQQEDSLVQLKLENYSKATVVTNMKLQTLSQQNKLKNLQLSLQRRNQLLMIIGISVLLFAFIFSYRRSRLEKLLEVEKLRSGIAADFHDELGSALSSIALSSEMALWGDLENTQKTKGILSQIGTSSRGTVSAMHDMIWTLQPKNDSMGEVILRMREFAFPLAELQHIELTLDVPEEIKSIQPSMDVRKNIYLVFKEALNNAFKYSCASQITVKLYKHQNQLNLEIGDNGVGFNSANAKAGNGLRNMYKRADQSKGKLSLESHCGGTRILFSCPVN